LRGVFLMRSGLSMLRWWNGPGGLRFALSHPSPDHPTDQPAPEGTPAKRWIGARAFEVIQWVGRPPRRGMCGYPPRSPKARDRGHPQFGLDGSSRPGPPATRIHYMLLIKNIVIRFFRIDQSSDWVIFGSEAASFVGQPRRRLPILILNGEVP